MIRRAIFIVLILLCFCSRQQDLIQEGEEYIKAGDVDRAMERFELASRFADTPEAQAGVGLVLSLKRMTSVTGLTMMEKALSRKFDLDLLGRLFTLYLDMGLSDRASASIGATRIGEDRYFLPEVEILRKTLQCLNGTRDIDGDSIRAVKTESVEYSSRRRSYAARCDVARLIRKIEGYYPYKLYRGRGQPVGDVRNPAIYYLLKEPEAQKFTDGVEAWQKILGLKEITRCEISKIYAIPADALKVDATVCRAKYPQSLVILRERPPELKEEEFFHFPEKLFDDSQFYPEFHKLPEYYYPGSPTEDRSEDSRNDP
ncbi:MAG: hypothetical protein KDK37_01895 [Leptospiraceae bacterium]|nr:hypothetical protein [Leptospiraceae bacterium]MCB1302994.1 hypothetical protein [Leptospiraceae bacterium]